MEDFIENIKKLGQFLNHPNFIYLILSFKLLSKALLSNPTHTQQSLYRNSVLGHRERVESAVYSSK